MLDREAARERVERRERIAKLGRDVDRTWARIPLTYDEQRILVGIYRTTTGHRPGISDLDHKRVSKARKKLEARRLIKPIFVLDRMVNGKPEPKFGDLSRAGAHIAHRLWRERGREFALDEHMPLPVIHQCTGKAQANIGLGLRKNVEGTGVFVRYLTLLDGCCP